MEHSKRVDLAGDCRHTDAIPRIGAGRQYAVLLQGSALLTKIIYPGSFDPLTFGHIDVIERSLRLFDQVVVAILTNPAKHRLFTVEERREMLEEIVRSAFPKVEVDVFHGLLVDYAKRKNAQVDRPRHSGRGGLRV